LTAEPFALGLSSGFFGFFAHAGFLSVLEEEALLPVRLSGASAGALVSGCWAAGLSTAQIAEALLTLERADFWDPGLGWGLLRGQKFRARLEALLPVPTFAECRAPVTFSAHDRRARAPAVLDTGALAPAIHASCAVPFMFQPVTIDGRSFCDGGVSDRPGLAGMPPGQRLLFHHLTSRSWWRRRGSPSLEIPKRDNMVALVLDGLPRSGPFKLDVGRQAFEAARATTRRAMDTPVTDGRLHLAVE
jgi:NTE family protein